MQKKPNVILVLTDDQSYWANSRITKELSTPAMRTLASDGVEFDRCFCASPVCSPARASIMTGMMPSAHGVHDWIKGGSVCREDIPEDAVKRLGGADKCTHTVDYLEDCTLITDVLSDYGYDVALSGKWHLGDTLKKRKGYVFWKTILSGGCHYYDYDMLIDGEIKHFDRYVTDVITDHALEFIDSRQQSDKPFYLGIHYTAPHKAWFKEQHPSDVWQTYDNATFNEIPVAPVHKNQVKHTFVGDTPQKRREFIQGYFTAVTAMDQNLMRVIDACKQKGIYEDTIFIFTGDNGMNLGHHGVWGKGNGTYPQNMYEQSVRVPLIIKPSGNDFKKGALVEQMVSHTDLFDTIINLVGATAPENQLRAGSSITSLLGGEGEGRDCAIMQSEFGSVRMLRTKTHKLVKNYVDGEHQLFDLTCDPGELVNLYDNPDYQEEVTRLCALLDEQFSRLSTRQCDGLRQKTFGRGQLDSCKNPRGEGVYETNNVLYWQK